jgi:very-short-patch-repair endonuclease
MQDKRLYPAPDDTRLAERAAGQHGIVSRAQLLGDGYTRHAIETRLRTGRLHRIYRGVYAVGHTKLTARGQWMAAVLACGKDAVLSHTDAAALHGLLRPPSGAIHLTAPTRHHIDGIRCHRAEDLDPRDVTEIDGIALTSLERTLLDIAGEPECDAAFKQAQHQDRLNLRRLHALVARHPGHRGVVALRGALADLTDEPGWTQSELERRFIRLTRAHHLPLPLTNQYVEGELVDAHWPDHRLIVEVDGWRTHKTRQAFEADRARDAKLAAAGYRVMRFTSRRLRDAPEGVADEIRRSLSAPRGRAAA